MTLSSMALITDLAELLATILSLCKAQSLYTQSQCVEVTTATAATATRSTSHCPGFDTSITSSFGAQIILPRQTTSLLCNPAHSYPDCQSCISGTAFGTTPGCTPSEETSTTSSTTTSTTTPTTTSTTTPTTTSTSI